MLSPEGINALVSFTNKTGAMIVTTVMTEQELAELEEMLLAWDADKSMENAEKIFEAFEPDIPPGAKI